MLRTGVADPGEKAGGVKRKMNTHYVLCPQCTHRIETNVMSAQAGLKCEECNVAFWPEKVIKLGNSASKEKKSIKEIAKVLVVIGLIALGIGLVVTVAAVFQNDTLSLVISGDFSP
jgi:DNA-directed RNA polymerase subunit RPC12/RpoP